MTTPSWNRWATTRPGVRGLAIGGLLLLLAFRGAAAPAASSDKFSPLPISRPDYGTPAEKAACAENLRRIYDAIQAYRDDNHELPDWLSDLVPKYIDDIKTLSCPVARRTGSFDEGGLKDPNSAVSYGYQFCQQPIPANVGGGSKRTMREWKRRQMGLVGDIVPMVRCRHHQPMLNLSFGGKVYESPPAWEAMMTNRFVAEDLSVKRLFPEDAASVAAAGAAPATAAKPSAKASTPAAAPSPNATPQPETAAPVILRIPPRDPQAPSSLIDLTDYYNAGLNETWHARPVKGYKHSDLAWLPKGIQTFAGVEFDVRGVVQLAGQYFVSSRFPPAVKGIRVSRKCRTLNFLHATGWSVPDGTRIGHFRVVYNDGEDREIPIIYGVDVSDWTLPGNKTDPADFKPVIAWVGKSPSSQSQGTTIRLFKTTWENPLPQARIDTLDYVSAQTNCAPFLIAITAE